LAGNYDKTTGEIMTKPLELSLGLSLPGRPRKYKDRGERAHAYYVRKTHRSQYPPLPSGPYRVLYADPPWQYRNAGLPRYGHAEAHYSTLSIEALCQLSIKPIVAPDAVLFLWVTSPLLATCFPVMTSWGFAYKTSIIWDKERHNFGHYVSVQHEFLLIGTRGRCRPDVQDLFGSVRRLPREDHSRKPNEFRMLIDTLYPGGRRLELFARSRPLGWDVWGNDLMLQEGETDGPTD
jgi:N6-adenosine-specific RNA methylase IME4